MAEFPEHVLGHAVRVCIVGHIALSQDGPTPLLLDLVDDVLRQVVTRHVVHGNVGALLGQGEGDCATDAAGGSGDERSPSRELHRMLLDETEVSQLGLGTRRFTRRRCVASHDN